MFEKIFKAYDVRATYPDPLNETAAWRVGYATAGFLRKHSKGSKEQSILVSRDMRRSSQALCQALTNGLRAAGANVIDLGLCDSSFMYFAVNHLDSLGGVQTTASHNPPQYNGFKISGGQARPVGVTTGLQVIQASVEAISGNPADYPLKGTYKQLDLWDAYRKHVLSFLSLPGRPLKVFVDGSNGMAGKMVPAVFGAIKNLEIVPANFEMTGSFVHDPNPQIPANMQQTRQGTLAHKAAFGACFDGDADRCVLADERGEIVASDHLLALLCAHFLRQAPGSAVVYDLTSSKAVEEEVLRLGGVPWRCRVGGVHVKTLLDETKGIFGGESSGHFYFRDNFCCDSGAIAFAVVLSVLGATDKPLSELLAPFRKYPQSGEINFKTQDKAGVLAALREKFASTARIDDMDGVTVDAWAGEEEGPKANLSGPRAKGSKQVGGVSGGVRGGQQASGVRGWWCNVRASNTEPLLRLNAEAKDQATLDWLLGVVTPMLGTPQVGH